MIDAARLLEDLTPLLRLLEDDMRGRCESQSEVDQPLRAEFAQAKQRSRTAQAYEEWRDDLITQSAVHWILGCVFVRFLEDNGLIAHPRDAAEAPYLSGPGARRQLASDRRTVYFQKHPSETDREYLLDVFEQVAALPAGGALYDKAHNPLWRLGPTGDGAGALMGFWQRIEPSSGELVHDFTDPEWNTRFLGDLYQDLSEAARKKYALLQTPEFVEEFILDRTLTPAIEAFGWREVRLIDPTCGSGHFLLGAFVRLLDLWAKHEPGTNSRELAQRVLDAVCGVDLNPFAVAIARFRLLVAALRASGTERLKDAPAFRIQLATGDSLLHGTRWQIGTSRRAEPGVQRKLIGEDRLEHFYASEDGEAVGRLLSRQYHAVVGNPPYIVAKDRAQSEAYRDRYGSCHMKYSLAVPFMERFFELALAMGDGLNSPGDQAGFVGMITSNSFMKREFGRKLIEEYIPRWDLTHVIDTSGAYIPGHGTPTVIIFGRHQRPQSMTIRAVMGIKGEPATPEDPRCGRVWSSILGQLDQPHSANAYVSVTDVARAALEKHPWSLGGGGAAELKTLLDEKACARLSDYVESIGFMAITGEDDFFVLGQRLAHIRGLPARPMVVGDLVRDWMVVPDAMVLFPYEEGSGTLPALVARDGLARFLWPYRTSLSERNMFGKTPAQHGLRWYEYLQFIRSRAAAQQLIAFAFVATHNHFVFQGGGRIFNRSAPVIELRKDASKDDHLALVGPLNSSTACFWMKQVFYPKGGDHVGTEGARVRKTLWDERFEFDGTKLASFPVPAGSALDLACRIERLAHTVPSLNFGHDANWASDEALRTLRTEDERVTAQLISLQEELDWHCYELYGLLDECLTYAAGDTEAPPLRLGERAFEIVLARSIAAGKDEGGWFERHGATPLTELPSHWTEDYRRVVERRIAAIETNAYIRLVEQPQYKRRWSRERWEERQQKALRSWLLERLESPRYWRDARLQTCARLADLAQCDPEFQKLARLFRGREGYDLTAVVTELVTGEAVPFLAVLRYKDAGLRKRAVWERTWQLQRMEDAIEAGAERPDADPRQPTAAAAKVVSGREVESIPVPPKYVSADFVNDNTWRLRGKLDVSKERFVSFPHCERDADPTLLVAWAGWDHLQQAQALAAYYVAMKEAEGWPSERLTPLLAGLLELQPWLDQWHNAFDPAYGTGMGDYFSGFVSTEARELGIGLEDIRAWRPERPPRRGKGRNR